MMHIQEKVDDILQLMPSLESERMPWENVWRQVDERVNPLGDGGFQMRSRGAVRGLENFDHTATLGLERFVAAIGGMIIPRGQHWHVLTTTDKELNKVPAVLKWLEHATDRLFEMRYNPHAGFETEANNGIRSLGSYGSLPMWVDQWPGRGLFYKCFHLSEIYVREDFRGRIDTIVRKWTDPVREIVQQFGKGNLPPLIAKAHADRKFDQEFELLHVVRPRGDRDPERVDFRRMAYESIYISVADKLCIREGGYRTMPMPFSRYVTSPGELYGRSPAIQVLGTIKTANEIARTLLRAGHKAVDPPLLASEDGVLSQIQTMPGGINVGGLDMMGRQMVQPMNTGANLPIGMEMLNNEREVIRDAFLEKVFSLVMERKDRMTATEVLEITRLQGMLATPTAGRQETEWLGVQIEREFDIGIDAGQIDPPPPEVVEAGAKMRVIYDNPLNRAARAEEALGFGRMLEMLTPLAAVDGSVFDVIDTEAAPRNLASSLGVRPSYLLDPDAVAAKRAAREQEKAVAGALQALPGAAGAVKDLAQARSEETALV